jgi:hypothetical protein
MLKEPFHLNQDYPKHDPTYEDTDGEMPAIAKISGTHNWHDSLPQVPKRLLNNTRPMHKMSYPPQWDMPPKKPIDIDKIVGRAVIYAGLAGFAVLTFLGSIYVVKLIQFSLAVSLK